MSDERKWAKLIVSAAKNQSIMLTDNGGEKFSFCYVTDTVSALIDILLSGKSGEAYNISNGNANVTMREFAQLVKSANPEKNLSVVFVHRKDEEEPEENKSCQDEDQNGRGPEKDFPFHFQSNNFVSSSIIPALTSRPMNGVC